MLTDIQSKHKSKVNKANIYEAYNINLIKKNKKPAKHIDIT